jgi:hypothetical protein
MAQSNRVKFISSTGRAQYVWLNQPDVAFGGEPKYKTNLIVDNSRELEQLCKEIAEKEFGAKASRSRMPFDIDEDTGETVIKIKSKYAPAFFDATGQPLVGKQVPKLYAGSIIRVGGYAAPYSVSGSTGISLQLTKVQVIEPAQSNSEGGDGFDAVEGGYVAPEMTQDDFDNEEQVLAEATESADRF